MIKQNKLNQIQKMLDTAYVSIENARHLMNQMVGKENLEKIDVSDQAKEVGKVEFNEGEKIVEGVFDGQNMIGPDGKQYSIPANYASKSKLVAGDTLKLTILPDGTFLYKQIGPIDRNRLVGILTKDDTTDEYKVIVGEKIYNVLLASITYFKGEAGDEVVILTPKDRECEWAAVENIIKIKDKEVKEEANVTAKEVKTESVLDNVEEIEDLD
ncbi:MAG: hypothetical protein ACNFW9_00875 [Candidatus Kerfeldbacteria bacterium]